MFCVDYSNSVELYPVNQINAETTSDSQSMLAAQHFVLLSEASLTDSTTAADVVGFTAVQQDIER